MTTKDTKSVLVRMPTDLHARYVKHSAVSSTSINELLVDAAASYIAAVEVGDHATLTSNAISLARTSYAVNLLESVAGDDPEYQEIIDKLSGATTNEQ